MTVVMSVNGVVNAHVAEDLRTPGLAAVGVPSNPTCIAYPVVR